VRLPPVPPPLGALVVRFPRGWRGTFHPQAARGPDQLAYRPGWRGTGMRPMTPVPVQRYTRKASGIPLTGGQAQGIVPGSGTITLQAAPAGLGTVWYPAQVTISTTTGQLDTSSALVYEGPSTILTPATLVGSLFSGNGVLALALPDITPGQAVTVVWTGATPGDTAAFNIIGTMDALMTQ
jgi:hypothetical protein